MAEDAAEEVSRELEFSRELLQLAAALTAGAPTPDGAEDAAEWVRRAGHAIDKLAQLGQRTASSRSSEG